LFGKRSGTICTSAPPSVKSVNYTLASAYSCKQTAYSKVF